MTIRNALIALPFVVWGMSGVILMAQFHVLPPWLWLLSASLAAVMTGVLGTYLESPPERYLRNRAKFLRRNLQPYGNRPSFSLRLRPPSVPQDGIASGSARKHSG